MLAKQLDAEVLRLEQEGIAATSSLGADSSTKPLGTVHCPLGGRFHLRDLLFSSEAFPHLGADEKSQEG